MGALLVVALKVGGDVRGVLVWIAINFVITFLWPGISWQGHLGGFVGGVVIAGIIVYAPRQRRTLWQVAGLVGVSARAGRGDHAAHAPARLTAATARLHPHLWTQLWRTTPVLFTALHTLCTKR